MSDDAVTNAAAAGMFGGIGSETARTRLPGPTEKQHRFTSWTALLKPKSSNMARTSQHVVPHPDGGWTVKKGGASRATKRFNTQKEAIAFGREISKNQGSEFYVHGRDGMIRQKDSYGKDLNPPKDKR